MFIVEKLQIYSVWYLTRSSKEIFLLSVVYLEDSRRGPESRLVDINGGAEGHNALVVPTEASVCVLLGVVRDGLGKRGGEEGVGRCAAVGQGGAAGQGAVGGAGLVRCEGAVWLPNVKRQSPEGSSVRFILLLLSPLDLHHVFLCLPPLALHRLRHQVQPVGEQEVGQAQGVEEGGGLQDARCDQQQLHARERWAGALCRSETVITCAEIRGGTYQELHDEERPM